MEPFKNNGGLISGNGDVTMGGTGPVDPRPVLVLGSTGMLGRPVVRSLVLRGCRVRALVRDLEAARRLLGDVVEIIGRRALEERDVQGAMSTYVTKLIDYFDRVGELADSGEANALLGAPTITLDEWFAMPHDRRHGLPH